MDPSATPNAGLVDEINMSGSDNADDSDYVPEPPSSPDQNALLNAKKPRKEKKSGNNDHNKSSKVAQENKRNG